jgi:uncharacterized membrane protein YidH (DUF202 family)
MSDYETGLPTDSLYKMLTIGGIVLVVGGLALSWKAIDQTQASQIALTEAEAAMSNSAVPVQLEYRAICKMYAQVENDISASMSGINLEAQKEFKGGQPDSFPTLAESLRSHQRGRESVGISYDAIAPPILADQLTVKEWIAVTSEMRKHHDLVVGFLEAPNLTIVGKDLARGSLQSINAIQKIVDSLEEKAIALAAPQQGLNSARLRHSLARNQQIVILTVGIFLLVLGMFIFVRASKNWYEQVQRYEDAKLQSEVKDKASLDEISFFRELRWLAVPIVLTMTIMFVIWCFWL